MNDRFQMDYDYNRGFDHGVHFLLCEIERQHEKTQSKDILALLLHLRGKKEEDEKSRKRS